MVKNMLNEASQLGIAQILSLFDDDNTVFSLCATITQGLSKNKISSRQEAVKAILNYCPDAISVLRRKIITREVLFSYLHKENIPFSLPATKSDLIKAITEFWSIQCNQLQEVDSGSIDLLAEQFTKWFYSMLNKEECFDHKHFYPDARVQLTMTNGSETRAEVIENSQQIVQRLFHVKMKYGLFFNINTSFEGVRGLVEPHGLVIVEACGTLHAGEGCVGVFEQKFGLVRDPLSDNNWRIKNSELNLRGQGGISAMPRLNVS